VSKTFIFVEKSFHFEQKYLRTGIETQNGEELSIDLIFTNNLW